MSIEITGPQMYKFQDRVCIEMMLRFFAKSDAEFYIEPTGGEDGRLTYTNGDAKVNIELQVKGSTQAVELADIAEYLAHFPARKSSNTLLEQLLNNADVLVVFVLSGRCTDEVMKYVKEQGWRGELHPDGHFRLKDVEQLLLEFLNVHKPPQSTSPLNKQRAEHCKNLVQDIDKKALQTALQRLIVIEQVTDSKIKTLCEQSLMQHHRIPSDQLTTVLNMLEATIDDVRGKGEDALLLLRQQLADVAPERIRPLGYVCRGDESKWVQILQEKSVLLLTGPPRVGKSDAARWVAAEFEQYGYRIREFKAVDEAERFLSDPTKGERLALLDDPFGSNSANANYRQDFSRLKGLVANRKPHRKLIVAQRQEFLLMAARRPIIQAIRFDEHTWISLDNGSATFLAATWSQYCQERQLPAELVDKVASLLTSGEITLEPGCLKHLLNNSDKLEERYDVSQIERIAREDAETLGQTLADEGFEKLLTILAISTSPLEPVSHTEICFIDIAKDDYLPGKRESVGLTTLFGQDKSEDNPFPQYDNPYQLADDDDELLEQIERRGMLKLLEMKDGTKTNFTHPFYRAAAQNILIQPTRPQIKQILAIAERGLFCLNPQTSKATARNFDWLFKLLENSDKKSQLVDIAIKGLRSYFPATRDICFNFLINNIGQFDQQQASELPKWIWPITASDLATLQWIDGVAWLPENSNLDFGCMFGIDETEVLSELEIANSRESSLLTGEQAARLLSFYKQAPDKMTLTAFERLLSFDEGIIRGLSVEYWFRVPRSKDEEVLVRVFNDPHPRIAYGILCGVQKSWFDYTEQRQAIVLQGLMQMSAQVHHALAMWPELIKFERTDNPPWAVFAAVFTQVLNVLPTNAVFNSARFYEVVRVASDELSPESMLKICDVWIAYLQRLVSDEKAYSEWTLSIIYILIKVTKQKPALRENRIPELLNINSTSVLLMFTRDLVGDWTDLIQTEQQAFIDMITSERADKYWLHGVVLTRNTVPRQLAEIILGVEQSKNKAPDYLLQNLNENLLEAVIKAYTGIPGLFCYFGTHAENEAVWEPVVELIATNPEHALFEIAWQHITYGGKQQRVARVIETVEPQHIYTVFEMLLAVKVNCVGHLMPEAWAVLFARAPDERCKELMLQTISEYLPAIVDDVWELKNWLDEQYWPIILESLPSDYLLHQFGSMLAKCGDDIATEVVDQLLEGVTAVFEKRPPKLIGSCSYALDLLNKYNISSTELRQKIETRRIAILDENKVLKQKQPLFDDSPTNWIGVM